MPFSALEIINFKFVFTYLDLINFSLTLHLVQFLIFLRSKLIQKSTMSDNF